jgi:ergothioneine biosynthesis protein EgtB
MESTWRQSSGVSFEDLSRRYARIRQFSERLCESLSAEDCAIQSMPDASPTRWHLAHTTWFFETFVLSQETGYRAWNAHFKYLFNSYYNAVGDQFPRSHRGLLSRPRLRDVMDYRAYVDERLHALLAAGQLSRQRLTRLELGLQHEQQHQELILTDIKHLFAQNPLFPRYRDDPFESEAVSHGQGDTWIRFPEGLYAIGHDGEGFAFDNESPQHRVFLGTFAIHSDLVTCGQYVEFIQDGGYRRPELWLSAGWQQVQQHNWQAPLYWHYRDGGWCQFTLAGLAPVDPLQPVCHVSYFEADAFARWARSRLPTEAEWEVAAEEVPIAGNFADRLLQDSKALHPSARPQHEQAPRQMFGDVWEWTASPYVAYPGFVPSEGALGEYNGKFMCNQFVLRGGSCATPQDHIRRTYRNFFPPEARWQFSGIRLARS